jgi:amidohydrolase
MSITQLKKSIIREIDSRSDRLRELTLKIHDNPELGFHETRASQWLSGYLEEHGFRIKRGIAGLETSFTASYGNGKPEIGILAEYDALPELGHACGHNLIAVSAVSAGIGAKLAADEYGGTITVIGTPAEELYGGKIVMAENGAFADLDVAMMVHPGTVDAATTEALACHSLYVDFTGKPAHAAARPEEGINALEAMILSFNAINSLRQHIKSTARVHGIITSGGEAANIVPAYSAGNFIVRAKDNAYLDELKEKVINCFKGAAEATGAVLNYKWDEVCYSPLKNNMDMAGLFVENMKSLGRDTLLAEEGMAFGSTDMGNVSQVVPSIHGIVAIAEKEVLGHSPEFAEAAASDRGIAGMLDAAKAMAMTVADVLSDPDILANIKEEFLSS